MSQPEQSSFPWGRMIEMIFGLVVGAGAASSEVFLHRRFGSRYLGVQASAVFLIVPMFAGTFPEDSPEPLIGFLAVYLLMVIIARIDIWKRRRKRDLEHSYYNGWPFLLRSTALRYEYFFKQVIEPILVFGVAAIIAPLNRPLGLYLLFSLFCLFFKTFHMNEQYQRQLMDADDALMEQQSLAERLRGLRG